MRKVTSLLESFGDVAKRLILSNQKYKTLKYYYFFNNNLTASTEEGLDFIMVAA